MKDYNLFGKTPLSPPIGEALLSDDSVHELADSGVSCDVDTSLFCGEVSNQQQSEQQAMVVNTALVARIESLEAENRVLKLKLVFKKPRYFCLEDIAHNYSLVRFYTGFDSYETLLTFYDFLGPSVNNLTYGGSKSTKAK